MKAFLLIVLLICCCGICKNPTWANQGEALPERIACYLEIQQLIDSAFTLDYQQGILLLQSKMTAWERCLPVRDTALGNVYHKTGVLYYITDQYEKAIDWFSRALQIREINPGWQTEGLLNTLNGLTQTSLLLFDYASAEKYIEKQIALIRSQNYTNREVEADIYYADGQLAYRREDYVRCREKLILAADLYRVYTPDNPNFGHVLNLLGVSCDMLKKYEEAFDWYKQAIRIFQKNQLVSDAGRSLHNIGISYEKIQQPDSALYYFNQSNAIHTAHQDTLEIARNYIEISKVFFNNKALPTAFSFAQKSYDLRTALLPDWHSDVIESDVLLGQLFSAQGQEEQAMIWFEKAIAAAIQSPRKDQVIAPLAEKAGLLARKGDIQQAAEANRIYLQLDSMIHQTRLKYQQEDSKIAFNQTLRKVYESAINNAMRLYKSTGKVAYFNHVLSFCERNKAVVLQGQMRKRAIQGFAGIPDSILQKEEQLDLQVSFQAEILLTSDKMPDSVKTNLRRNLDQAQMAREKFSEYLATGFPAYFNLIHDPDPALTVSALQEKLSPETLLLEFYAGDSSLTILAIGKHHFEAWQLNNIPSVNDNIRKLLDMTEAPQQSSAKAFCQLARELYRQLLEQPLSHFAKSGIQRLQIVPDGALSLLPFDVLLTSDYDRMDNQTPYLIKKYSHTMLYSNRILVEKKPARKWFANRKNVVFAIDYRDNPDLFAFGSNQQATSPPTVLDYSGKEMEAVGDIINGKKFQNREATVQHFLREISHSHLVHLSAHGIFNPENPMLSGILFSKKDTQETYNNLLTAARIYGIRTSASFIFLSACNTGSGQVIDSEGVMSIARAFTYAGTRSQVMTLWSVSDRSTGQIAEHFYRYLKRGKPKDDALRLAKLDYLAQTPTAISQHPVYWAGMVNFGDTDPLFIHYYWKWGIIAGFTLLLLLLIKRWK